MEDKKEIYSTKDIYLATSFECLGYMVESIDIQFEGIKKQPVGYFNFEKTENLNDSEKEYYGGKLSFEPKAFISTMRGLKGRVENKRNNPNFAN